MTNVYVFFVVVILVLRNISTQYFVFWMNWPQMALCYYIVHNLITLTRAPNSGVSGTGTTNENTQSLSAGPGDSMDT